MGISHLLTSHWPKTVTWPSLTMRWKATDKVGMYNSPRARTDSWGKNTTYHSEVGIKLWKKNLSLTQWLRNDWEDRKVTFAPCLAPVAPEIEEKLPNILTLILA